MCHGVTQIEQLEPLVAKAGVIILGPGLGQSEWAKVVWSYVMEQKLPLVVDADGLNLLSERSKINENWVLTPHPGEAGRLLGVTAQRIQEDRLAAIKAINKRYGGVCVLKGVGSLVLAPNSLPGLCDKGNPGHGVGRDGGCFKWCHCWLDLAGYTARRGGKIGCLYTCNGG